MKFSIIVSTVALASVAVAKPVKGCVSGKDAHLLVTRYIGLQNHEGSDLGDATATGEAILTSDYSEISDSILSLEQRALGGITFSSRSAYLAGLLQSPATTDIQPLGVYVAGCNKILWQWQYNNVGISEYPVKGFNLFTTNRKKQLVRAELEFNSIAWGQDTYQLPCSANATTTTTGGTLAESEPAAVVVSTTSTAATPATTTSGEAVAV